MHQYRPYLRPHRPGRYRELAAWIEEKRFALVGTFFDWFFEEIDWRWIDRIARRCLTFFLISVAVYVSFLVVYEIAVIIAVAYGVMPKW